MDTYSPHAAFNGRVPVSGDRRSAKPPGAVLWHGMGSTPNPSAKLFERSELPGLKFVLARFIPIWRFALGTNPRLADRVFSRLPLVEAAVTFITFFPERDHAHDVNNIPAGNIFAR